MKKIKIMSLWKNTTKDGDTFLSGNFGNGRKVMIFKNTFKRTEKDPDFNVFVCEDEKVEQPVAQKTAQESNFDVPF